MANAIYTTPSNDVQMVQIDLEDYLNGMTATVTDYATGRKIQKCRITVNN